MCRLFKVSHSAYYAWQKKAPKKLTPEEFRLNTAIKSLFKSSRQSLGSRAMTAALNKRYEIKVKRGKVRRLMQRLKLKPKQRQAYKVTTNSKHKNAISDNHLDQDFYPQQMNQHWAGDITYLRTRQGWLYLAVVIDLYSRRVVGYAMSERMTQQLVVKALKQAITLRKPPRGDIIFHSDRGSQYSSKAFQKLLHENGFWSSMSGKGACWDNAVVERFFGSLKNEWLLNIIHLTKLGMMKDVGEYIKYYNYKRLHSTLGYETPAAYEKCSTKVSGIS